MYAPPVQSLIQQQLWLITQKLNRQFTSWTLSRPKITANSSIYPHNQDQRAGLHSYGMGNAPNRHSGTIYNQSPPMYNWGPMGKSETSLKILPINTLNLYLRSRDCDFKAVYDCKRVELRLYNKAKGMVKFVPLILLDARCGAVRITCFNAVADQFYDQIEAGKVYFVSKGSVKPAQKAFNHLKNDHEIMLDSSSMIQPCYDDDSSIPQQQFNLRQIAEIEGLDNISVLDIIGVVFRIFPTCIVKKKGGTETQKRNLHIKDMSRRSVDVTSWGNFYDTNGQTLQNMCCTDFHRSYRIKFGLIIRGNNMPSIFFISRRGRNTDVRKMVSQIKEEKLGTSEKADWITVSGNVGFLKVDSFYYIACPLTINDRKGNKKATNNGDGKWRCDRCDKDVDECDYRYILQFQIQDHTGITWVTAFEKGGEAIMGVTAKEETFDDDSRVKITQFMGNAIGVGRQTGLYSCQQAGWVSMGNQYKRTNDVSYGRVEHLRLKRKGYGIGEVNPDNMLGLLTICVYIESDFGGNVNMKFYSLCTGYHLIQGNVMDAKLILEVVLDMSVQVRCFLIQDMEDDVVMFVSSRRFCANMAIRKGMDQFLVEQSTSDITDHSSEKLRIKMCPTRLRADVVTVLTEKAALLLPQHRTDQFRIRQIKSTYKVSHVLSEIEALVYMNWQV
ncbi:replication protein A 70 kDa DNA-binding subunit A-like protein [Tanacetum coccineum]